MKAFLGFSAVLSLIGVLNCSTLHTGTHLQSDNPQYSTNLGYSSHGPYGWSGYGTSRSPGTSSSIGFTANSWPYGTNYVPSHEKTCNYRFTNKEVTDYRVNILKFMTPLFKRAAVLSGGHFALSLYTIWLTLAVLAEATDGPTRQELFSLLHLPEDRCLRQFFYQMCTTRENPSNDVFLVRNRFFITDSSLHINRNWENFARSQTHLNTISVPFKYNPFGEIELLKRTFNVQLPNLNLNGNSFFLETLDYRGLWTSAFSDAVIEVGPFYNNFGKQVGTVEYMKLRQRVKAAYVSTGKMKIVGFPVGGNERYTMLFSVFYGNQELSRSVEGMQYTSLFEYLAKAKETPAPIDILIPKFTMTSEMDVRRGLEDLGIKAIWTDPSATRNFYPAALPSSYMQRVSVVIDNSVTPNPGYHIPDFVHNSDTEYSLRGVPEIPGTEFLKSYLPTKNNNQTGYSLHGVSDIPEITLFRDFVANEPFVFALFDSETYTCLFAGTFSNPGYLNPASKPGWYK